MPTDAEMSEVNPEDFGTFFGPPTIDKMLREAIKLCWMALPKERRSVKEVEAQVRRMVDRALKDLREDAREFGTGRST